ncbi:hypothetical protein QCD60_10550 [Pokkaliibacter sp. MBI-7]|uniref:hypothetical protein n=1 Tax=Pokkaliibacter sp. MBI-7 TaxID=3040600 RepID=UPI002448CE3A|nr:hypothetical protein [Pokkaliibacter sp. MBI-7]MDH2433007.1 hypothetical protein [Pokkaliibacter sp. MBI-7]
MNAKLVFLISILYFLFDTIVQTAVVLILSYSGYEESVYVITSAHYLISALGSFGFSYIIGRKVYNNPYLHAVVNYTMVLFYGLVALKAISGRLDFDLDLNLIVSTVLDFVFLCLGVFVGKKYSGKHHASSKVK